MVLFLFLFSIIAYLLLPTFVKMWQKRAQKAPFGASEASGVRSYDYLLLTYHLLLTYVLLSYYLLFIYLLLNQDVSKIAPEMRPRSERSERSTFILRTDYVFIIYFSRSYCVLITYFLRYAPA